MSAGTSIEQRSVILIPFPYTDLSGAKKRPALVLSSNEFNAINEDLVCCLITSNPKSIQHSVKITNKDMESGHLDLESKVKPYRIFTVNKRLIYKSIGKLGRIKSKLVVDIISNIINLK
jgi:mRNA interferase MazF